MPTRKIFYVVGVRADGSRKTICALHDRVSAEQLAQDSALAIDFKRLEIVEAEEPPASGPPQSRRDGNSNGTEASQ